METRSDILASSSAMLASPNGASMALGLSGAHTVRYKNGFYVRFVRPKLSTSTTGNDAIGFVIKAIDMPSVQPQVEELTQYGKKRVIYTGVKYSPVNATFYDTKDSVALALWNEYARYHFGDFSQDSTTAWQDDIVSEKMVGPSTFGFKPRPADSLDGLNSQFFFERIEIFQVYGGTFVQTDLVHPKISNFEMDGGDYEDAGPVMIRMGFTYEGIVYRNGGLAQPLSADTGLTAVFNGLFSGQVINVSGGDATAKTMTLLDRSDNQSNLLDKIIGQSASTISTLSTYGDSQTARLDTSLISSDGGVLSKFGNFSFGSVDDPGTAGVTTTSGWDPTATYVSTLNTGDWVKLDSIVYASANANSDGTAQIGINSFVTT